MKRRRLPPPETIDAFCPEAGQAGEAIEKVATVATLPEPTRIEVRTEAAIDVPCLIWPNRSRYPLTPGLVTRDPHHVASRIEAWRRAWAKKDGK